MRNPLKTIVLLTLALAALSTASPSTARASSDSLLTLGVGTSMSVGGGDTSGNALSGTVRSRLRVLLGLGAELTYAPAGAGQRDATTGVHGLLYVLPTRPVGGYLKGGLTNARLGTFGTEDDRYEVGFGLEFYLGEHVAVGAEYLRSFPNVQALSGAMADGADLWGTGRDVWTLTVWWFT